MIGGGGLRLRGGRLGQYAPVPFVGAAALLVAVIVFTPVLLATGPSPLAVRAELTVYRVTGSPTTQFYVRGVGEVAYASIHLAIGSGFDWHGTCPASGVNWSFDNQSDVVEVMAATNATPVVVDAVATYDQGGTLTVFAGAVAFYLVNPGASDENLAVATCASTPGMTAPGSIATTELPVGLYLVNFGSAGPP